MDVTKDAPQNQPPSHAYLLRNGDRATAFLLQPPLNGIWFFQGQHRSADGTVYPELWGVKGNYDETMSRHDFDIAEGPLTKKRQKELEK